MDSKLVELSSCCKRISHHLKYLSFFVSVSSTSFFLQVLSGAKSQDSIQETKESLLRKTKNHDDAFIQMNDDTSSFVNNSENLINSSSRIVNNSSREVMMLQLNSESSINGSNILSVASPPEESMKFPLYMRILATFACLLIFIVGVCGNLLVPIVVIKTKYLRNSTNLFLINLAVADLLVLIICEPTLLIELHSRPETWLLGEPMCKYKLTEIS